MAEASNLVKAIRLESPSVIPTSVSILPAMWIHYGDDTQHLIREFPQFFPENYSVDYSDPNAVAHGTYKVGEHVDEWGCVWSNVDEGMGAIVTGHPVKTPEDVYSLEIPKTGTAGCPTASCTCGCWISAALKTP